jgi:hypothetical protein
MSDLAWHKAAGVLGLSADKRAAGWPEAFTAEHLARLQYPSNGSVRPRCAFVAAIKAAIEANAIRPEYKDVTISLSGGVQRYVRPAGGVFAKPEWEREFSYPSRHSSARVVTKQYDARLTLIPRAEFARWWGKQGEAASEHIEAWLTGGTQGAKDDSRNNRILAALDAGKSQAEVAKEFRISRGRVGQIARKVREKQGDATAQVPTNNWALLAGGKNATTTKLPTTTRKTAKR